MSGNVLGMHVYQDMQIEAQREMQRKQQELQSARQSANEAAAEAVAGRRAAVSNLNLHEYSAMQDADTSLKAAQSNYNAASGEFYGLFEKMGKAVLNCRKDCNSKYSGLVDKYQRDACLAGCNMSVPGVADESSSVLGPHGERTRIASCSGLQDKGPQYCKSWTQTDCCSHLGPEDTTSSFAKGLVSKVASDCNTPIPSGASGWCTCSDGSKTGIVDCGHPAFSCNEACAPASKRPYTFDQAPKDCTLTDQYPYLVSCSQKGYCYDGLKDETYTTYFEEGEACPSTREVAGTPYYLKQSGRSGYCAPADQFTVPFCPDPQYDSFPTRLPKTGTACSSPNTRESCIQTAHPGWRPDASLCVKKNPSFVQKPCFIDPIRSWDPPPTSCKTYQGGASTGFTMVCYREKDASCLPPIDAGGVGNWKCQPGDTLVNNPGKGNGTGHVYTTFNSVPGLNIYAGDVDKIRESPALYFYTVPPPKGPYNESFYPDPITSMTKDNNGTLYIHTQMNPGNGKAGPVKIPAQYANCFDGAAVLYIGPKPGTPELPPPPTYWPASGANTYIYYNQGGALAGCKKGGYDRLCSKAEVTSMGGKCAAGYIADETRAGYYFDPKGGSGAGCGGPSAGWRTWFPSGYAAGAYCCDGPPPKKTPGYPCKCGTQGQAGTGTSTRDLSSTTECDCQKACEIGIHPDVPCNSWQFYLENGESHCYLHTGGTTAPTNNQNCGGALYANAAEYDKTIAACGCAAVPAGGVIQGQASLGERGFPASVLEAGNRYCWLSDSPRDKAADGGMKCPPQYPHLRRCCGPGSPWWCYASTSGASDGCNCQCPDCGTNSGFPSCASFGGYCTSDGAQKNCLKSTGCKVVGNPKINWYGGCVTKQSTPKF